jgi:hypothetical protein
VSGAVGRHRHLPLCPTISVVFCRRLSPCVGGHWGTYWGTYWGSLCFRGRSSPGSAYPIRGRNPLTYGLIRRLFLAELVRSVSPLEPRILRWKRLRPSRSVPFRSSGLLALLLAEDGGGWRERWLRSRRAAYGCDEPLMAATVCVSRRRSARPTSPTPVWRPLRR